MTKTTAIPMTILLCTLATAACDSASPTAPTEPEPAADTLAITLAGPADTTLVEGGPAAMVTATANRAVTADTTVELLHQSGTASPDDYRVAPIVIRAGETTGTTMLTAVEDNQAEQAETLTLQGRAGSVTSSNTLTFTIERQVDVTGTWRGSFTGNLVVSDSVRATLTQTGSSVSGDWSTPMPAALVVVGAPAGVNLTGAVTGTATGTTAELSFAFEGFQQYFAPGCALALTVSSVTATTMAGTWTTNTSCQAPVVDQGTLSLTRQ